MRRGIRLANRCTDPVAHTLRSIDVSEFGWTSRENARWLSTFTPPKWKKTADRRRSPRIDLMGQIQGELASMDLPIVVLDISLGGMRVATPIAFEVGARGQFLLTLGDGAVVVVTGRIVRCEPLKGASPAAFVSGVQFLGDDDAAGPTGVSDLVRKVE